MMVQNAASMALGAASIIPVRREVSFRVPALTVSVVVPTRDRLGSLAAALDALRRQREAGPFELIVVDDGSADGTGAFLAGLAAQGALVHLRGERRGPAAARNAGIARARGTIIACTDDDCEVPTDWVGRLRGRLVETGAAAVGGRVVAAADASRAGRISQAIANGVARVLNDDGPEAAFLTSNNVAYRADVLRESGLFDEGFTGAGGEERELHERLRARGLRLVYDPGLVVAHRPRMGWSGFVRQQAAYGRGARRFYDLPRGRSPRPRGLGLGQYLRAFAAAVGEVRPGDRAALALGLPLSQAAVAWGYLRAPRP
jgi:glycosyltransferase involved in cell wall biosynthesis